MATSLTKSGTQILPKISKIAEIYWQFIGKFFRGKMHFQIFSKKNAVILYRFKKKWKLEIADGNIE
jgi:hypothetical protein